MGWRPLDKAAQDLPAVWLFLPAASWKARPDGTVAEVQHAVVLGRWDGHWLNKDGNAVYPSLWNDADITGEAPQDPELSDAAG